MVTRERGPVRGARAALVAVAGALGLACGGLPFGSGPVALRNDLDEAGARAATALAGEVVDGRFPEGLAAACEEHAVSFVWLAARDDDPAVIGASLRAAAGCAEQLDPVDARAVATARLADPRPEVGAAAFVLAEATVAGAEPDDPLVVALLAAADDPSAEVRYEALAALDRRAWSVEPEIAAAFAAALGAEEPPLVTETLRRLRFRAAGLADPAPFRQGCLVLAYDQDPGIRGRALLALARVAPDDEEVRAVVLGGLEDPHPYTRSAAAEALADMGYLPAVHALVGKLDDPTKNTWDMLPFQRLDGTSEVAHHVGSLFERADDAVLRALVRLTEPLGDDRFVYRDVNLRWLHLDVIAATRDARRWYETHRDLVPER